MRVLIVEDSADEAATFADLVTHFGHEPTVVSTAEAALDSLAVSPPDAVLLDLFLPGMTGVDLLRLLAERQQPLPVVAISGVATESDARSCLALGALEFLPKPFGLDQMGILLDFLELQVLTRRFTADLLRINRRRYPRAEVSLEVRLEVSDGDEFHAESVDVSPFGIKVRRPSPLPPGGTVRLSFQPPDAHQRISVLCLLVRKDPDGDAFTFVNLTDQDFARLKRLVDARRAGGP
jgi:CheY-like chemotaxis protein